MAHFLSKETKLKIKLYHEANFRVSYDDCELWAKRGLIHLVMFDEKNGKIATDWMKKNFKGKNFSWANGVAAFKSDEQAVMFKLLWGQ